MPNIVKKIVAIVTTVTCAVWLMGPGVVQGITAAELQAQIDALMAQLAGLQAQLAALTGAPTIEGCTITSFDRNLKQGMSGDDVNCLQIVLNSDSDTQLAATGVGSPGNETSYFGPLTKAAVIKFQEKYADEILASWGLTTGTGFVGSTTRAKLNSLLTAAEEEEEEEEEVVVPAAGLAVALAADTPASSTYVRDTGAVVAQSTANFVKFNFTASAEGAAKVTTLKLTRSGVSADADLSNVYLYEGNTKLAEMTSFASKVITFTDAAGLFTVAAGTTKAIMVKADIAAINATVASIVLGINSAADITTDASAVSGTFPMNGNTMAVGTVTDLGYANITTYTTYPTTIDPGVTDYELWRFNVTASDQKMAIEKVVLTMVGTVSASDVVNLKLEVAGTQIGSTVAKVDANNKAIFDLTASPGYEITSGATRTIVVKGDVPTGTARTFKFTIRTVSDFIVKDTNYGVYVAPLKDNAAFTLVEPTALVGTTINVGTLTITLASDSPSGNVASAATGVLLLKVNYKANGEAIKLSTIGITVNEEAADADIRNGKLYYNGSQIGITDTSVDDEAENDFSLGNAMIIPAGETGVVEYKADIIADETKNTETIGTGLTAGQTLIASISAGTTDATGQSSLSSIASAAVTGRTLTVATGALTAAKNLAMADATATNPTGVVGATNVKVASFVLTAGSGEGVTVTQVVVGDKDAGDEFGAGFQNLKLMHNTTPIGQTRGTLSTVSGADFSFTPSPPIVIAAGQQYVIDAYADILSTLPAAGDFATAEVGLEAVSVTATGNVTSSDASWSGPTDLQQILISAAGTLTITANAAQPLAGQMVMGDTDQVFAMLNFTAGSAENINVSRIEISDSGTTGYRGSLSSIKLFDGTTQIGSTIASLDATDDAEFNLTTNWVIPKNTTKVLTIKSTPNAYPNATSGSDHILGIAAAADVDSRGADSGQPIGETVTSAVGNPQDIYRTKATVAKNTGSPSGASVAGAGATVLIFDVTADSGYNAILNAVALTVSGSANIDRTGGTGDANLYKSTNLTTPLATEARLAITAGTEAAEGSVDNTTTSIAGDTDGMFDGVPVGATIRMYDASAGTSSTHRVVSIVDDADDVGDVLTFTPAMSAAVQDAADILYYLPMQPGTGKVYFGAQTTLGADVAETATSLTVSSINGFATGDTVTIVGYETTTGTAMSGTATIAALSGTTITLDAAPGDMNGDADTADTLDYNYLATAANAVTKGFTGNAIVYTGLISTTGEQITAGTTTIFYVKGDTTGATTTNTLRVDIAAVGDLNWDDTLVWGVITDTSGLPLTGGTLTY